MAYLPLELYRIKLLVLVASILGVPGAISNLSPREFCEVCQCVFESNIITLDCIDKGLMQFPKSWPQQLTNLNDAEERSCVIAVNRNNITKLEAIPKLISKQVSISIQECGIKEITYAAFKDIENIHYLDLSHNKLTGDAVRSDVFRGQYSAHRYEPINLEILNLENNLIASLERRMFQHTPYLKTLFLKNNPISTIDPVTLMAIASISMLQVLDISNIGIKYLPDDIFRNSKQLQDLDLSSNKLTEVPEALGAVGATLQYLVVSDNLIQKIDDNSFLGLWRLELLKIDGMRTLTQIQAGAFSQLHSLQTLHITNNKQLRDINRDAFRELKLTWMVKEFYLNGNNLRTLPADLAPWKKLQLVDLQDNPWNCNCDLATILKNKDIVSKLPPGSNTICMTPTKYSGQNLKDLSLSVCSSDALNKTPRTKISGTYRKISIIRPGSIFVGLAFIGTIVLVGVGVGMAVAYIRNKLRRVSNGETIRYTNLN